MTQAALDLASAVPAPVAPSAARGRCICPDGTSVSTCSVHGDAEHRRDVLAFTVHGTPQPAGSKRRVPIPGAGSAGFRTIDDNRKAGPWKDQVAQRGGEAMAGRPVLQGALEIRCSFYRVRPKGHYGARGNLLPSAPAFPTTKPDATKLLRAVEDALTGVVWRDDAQIVVQTACKLYGPERVEIEVRTL